MTSKEMVLSVYPDATAYHTSDNYWTVLKTNTYPRVSIYPDGVQYTEADAWEAAKNQLPSAPSPAGETASEPICMWCHKIEARHTLDTVEGRTVRFCDSSEHHKFTPALPEPVSPKGGNVIHVPRIPGTVNTPVGPMIPKSEPVATEGAGELRAALSVAQEMLLRASNTPPCSDGRWAQIADALAALIAPAAELKPCPFCGSGARWATTDGGDDSWEIQCSSPDCCVVLFAGNTGEETRKAWNTRPLVATPSAPEAAAEDVPKSYNDFLRKYYPATAEKLIAESAAPITAEEQLPPLDITQADKAPPVGLYLGMEKEFLERLNCRTRQLLAALRSNREKDANSAELKGVARDAAAKIFTHRLEREAAEAKLRAVSEAMKNPDPWACLKRIRAIVEGK